MKKLQLLILSACIATPAYCGEITEIELPDLIGSYVGRDMKCSSFQFDRIPQTIYGMKLRLTGVFSPGMQYCEAGGVGLNSTLAIRFFAEIPDTIPDVRWLAMNSIYPSEAFIWQDEEFDFIIEFEARNGVTWEILQDGVGQVDLSSREDVSPASCDMVHPYFPSCVITTAVLIVDADIIVGTESSSWGAIKTLMK